MRWLAAFRMVFLRDQVRDPLPGLPPFDNSAKTYISRHHTLPFTTFNDGHARLGAPSWRGSSSGESTPASSFRRPSPLPVPMVPHTPLVGDSSPPP